MIDVRWTSPFEHTIPFSLFHKHFTEINDAYWAYVPAASTIEKRALEGLQNEAEDPRKYFLISDEDDRRVANTYDILKFFYFFARKNNLMSEPPTVLARELRKQLGSRGLQTVGQEYYKNLMEYFCLNDEDCVFRYSRNACIKEVNRRIADISISADGKKCDFSAYFFRMFCKKFKVNENPDYTEMHKFKNCEIYFYSDKMIDSIVSFLQNYPNSFLNLLREQ